MHLMVGSVPVIVMVKAISEGGEASDDDGGEGVSLLSLSVLA